MVTVQVSWAMRRRSVGFFRDALAAAVVHSPHPSASVSVQRVFPNYPPAGVLTFRVLTLVGQTTSRGRFVARSRTKPFPGVHGACSEQLRDRGEPGARAPISLACATWARWSPDRALLMYFT